MANKNKFKVFLLLAFFGICFVMIYNSRSNYLGLEINGRIETIGYDTTRAPGKNKNYTTASVPYIKVNNKNYVLLPNITFKENVEIGDSIVKFKGERDITVIKKWDHKVMVIKF